MNTRFNKTRKVSKTKLTRRRVKTSITNKTKRINRTTQENPIMKNQTQTYLNATKAQVKKIIDDIIVTSKIPQCEQKIQLYGMEIIKIKDIKHTYETLLGDSDTRKAEKTILSIYKIINIIIYIYSMIGMSWLEYYVLLPSGNDDFWYMVHNLPELFVFLTSFMFIPEQLNSDWIFSLLIKDIGLLSKTSIHSKYLSNQVIINIIYSIQALLYRTTGNKLLVKAKNHLDDILLLKDIVLKSNLPYNKKNRLRFLIILLKTQKTKNPQITIHHFERLIISSSENKGEQRELLLEALKEGEKIYNRNKKIKQDGGY